MYCIKCLCPKGLNHDRKSCRVHSLAKDDKCKYCKNNKGCNCYHEWESNYKYYIRKCIVKI